MTFSRRRLLQLLPFAPLAVKALSQVKPLPPKPKPINQFGQVYYLYPSPAETRLIREEIINSHGDIAGFVEYSR
jgi:hypothetical protein